MKRIITSFITAAALSINPALALASSTLPTPTPSPVAAPSVEQSRRMNTLKAKGASEIDRRLDKLQKAADKASLISQLSKKDADNIKSQLATEIDHLTKLKTKLANDTDLASARVDIQAIIDSYRIYGLLLPKARIIAAADRFLLADNQFQTLRTQLQHKITLAKQQGKDVTALQKSLDDMRAKLAGAEPKYDGLAAKLVDLATTDYPVSYRALTDAYTGLRTARTGLSVAQADAKSILDGLGNLKAATPTPSASPSPSGSTTPSPAH